MRGRGTELALLCETKRFKDFFARLKINADLLPYFSNVSPLIARAFDLLSKKKVYLYIPMIRMHATISWRKDADRITSLFAVTFIFNGIFMWVQ